MNDTWQRWLGDASENNLRGRISVWRRWLKHRSEDPAISGQTEGLDKRPFSATPLELASF